MTIADLPTPATKRWLIRGKTEFVAAARGGLPSHEQACGCYAGAERNICPRRTPSIAADLRPHVSNTFWLDLADRFDRRSERRALSLYLMSWFSRLGYLKPRSRPLRSDEVITRTNDTGDKTRIYRIAANCEIDGNHCRGHIGHDGRADPPGRNEGIHGPADQFGRKPLQTGSSQSISCGSRYFVGGCGAALAMVSIIIGLEVSVATGSGAEPGAEIARKGDRLPLIPAFHRKAVNQPLDISIPSAPASDLEIADNCESLVSSLAHSPLGHIAGRCLS
jgi:hypothetical protein